MIGEVPPNFRTVFNASDIFTTEPGDDVFGGETPPILSLNSMYSGVCD